MSFTDMQVVALESKLKAKNVKVRQKNGVTLSFIEGWHAISEANRIFGFDGWCRETLETRCVWEGRSQNLAVCTYLARVRIKVIAEDREITREGSGSGHGIADIIGEAHEAALKTAETDATKRALATFGNPFGLPLYDREQRGVTRRLANRAVKTSRNQTLWELIDQEGGLNSQHTDPVDYCANFRRMLENAAGPKEAKAFWEQNENTLLILRTKCPDLKSDKGQHYADILAGLYTTRQKAADMA